MGIMRWSCYSRLKERYPSVKLTYGYLTKNARIRSGLEKSHITDARCISGNPLATPLGHFYYQKKVRCHNRQIHKATTGKGGVRRRNQAEYLVKGFRLFDKVSYKGQECFIFGRRQRGSFLLKTLSGEKIGEPMYTKLMFLETKHNYITERRKAQDAPAGAPPAACRGGGPRADRT